jgi:Phosphoesterase family
MEATPLDACFDPNHGHETAWIGTYDGGLMDGACGVKATNRSCAPPPENPPDTYVSNATGILSPYYQIASTYAFANYFFQTNQGPSFPAHQFLFSGTSAPVPYGDPSNLWNWFAGEVPTSGEFGANTPYAGCAAPGGPSTGPANPTVVLDINPTPPPPEEWAYTPPNYPQGFPCYTHNTLASLLESNGKTWSYYAPPGSGPTQGNTMWTAPNAISSICLPLTSNSIGTFCNGTDWNSNVKLSPTALEDYAPILSDITNCNMQANVAWVTPDGAWSDHPGTGEGLSDGGPSWVAAIVNAVGAHNEAQNNDCTNGSANWENTVILITWDDWGGWYDHVSPASAMGGPGGNGYPNSGNPPNGQYYVYGFRVPLLVVSAYGTSAGYISGNPNKSQGEYAPYIHDFGSILGFIENALGLSASNPYGIAGNQKFPYADFFAPDGKFECPTCQYPLSDFFIFGNSPTTFVPITNGVKYPPNCFHTPTASGCFGSNYQPSDPDDDGIDEED